MLKQRIITAIVLLAILGVVVIALNLMVRA